MCKSECIKKVLQIFNLQGIIILISEPEGIEFKPFFGWFTENQCIKENYINKQKSPISIYLNIGEVYNFTCFFKKCQHISGQDKIRIASNNESKKNR